MSVSGIEAISKKMPKIDKYDRRARDQFKYQYDLMLKQQKQEQAWSAKQAQKQMDFQREMSDTAHQREIADLKAAGLNPVLSAGGNGASSPAGSEPNYASSIVDSIPQMFSAVQAMADAQREQAAAAKAASRSYGYYVRKKEDKEEEKRILDLSDKKQIDEANEQIKMTGKFHGPSMSHPRPLFKNEGWNFEHPSLDKRKIITAGSKAAINEFRKTFKNIFISGRVNGYGPSVSASGNLQNIVKFEKAALNMSYRLGKDLYSYPYRAVKALRYGNRGMRYAAYRELKDQYDYASYLLRK